MSSTPYEVSYYEPAENIESLLGIDQRTTNVINESVKKPIKVPLIKKCYPPLQPWEPSRSSL